MTLLLQALYRLCSKAARNHHAIIEPFNCMLLSNMPARESILDANVYQEMLVYDSFCVERMSFTEQRVLV